MATEIRRVEYFCCHVREQPGEVARLLSVLATEGVNLLAFTAIPMGVEQTQMVFFPKDPDALVRAAEGEGCSIEGPHAALLVRGDDELGALADLHRRLANAGVSLSAAVGLTDGRGGFSPLMNLSARDANRAQHALSG